MTRRLPPTAAALPALVVLSLSAPVHAYVGPGAGLGVIGTLFGIVAAIVLALFGLLWYPLKRAFGWKGAPVGAAGVPVTDDATDATDATDGVDGAGVMPPVASTGSRREVSDEESTNARDGSSR